MLSMKNWHGNWLERVLDVLDMLFLLYYDPLRYTFPFACHEISLSASLILSYSNIRVSLTTLLKRSSEGQRTMKYTILLFITENQCNWDCSSLQRSLCRLIYQSSVNCQVSNSWKYRSPKFPDEKKCMPDGLPTPHCLPRIRIHFFEN